MSKKKFVSEIYPIDRDLKKKWFLKYRFKGLESGKWMKANIPSLPNVSEREKIAQEISKKIEVNGWMPLQNKTVVKPSSNHLEMMFDLLESRKGTLSDKSYSTMKSHLKVFNNWCKDNGHKSVSYDNAESFLDWLMGKGRHPKTVNNYRTTLNAAFVRLVKRGRVRKNPFKETEKKKGESDCPNWFKEHEFDRLEKYLRTLKHKAEGSEGFLWAAARWIFYCLMRPSSTLRHVRVGDVDWTRWQVKLNYRNTKNSDSYWVPIPDELKVDLLPLKLWEYPPSWYLVGECGLPSKVQVGKNFWNRHFKKVLTDLEFITDDYYFYCFKHTGFAHGYLNGVSIIELMHLAGHKDIRHTMKYMRRLGLEDFPNLRSRFRKLSTLK